MTPATKTTKKTAKNSHGGSRPGAGRPKGSGTGRKVRTGSICLPPAMWNKLDGLRGLVSRSKFISNLIDKL
jgi:hypothetical protein